MSYSHHSNHNLYIEYNDIMKFPARNSSFKKKNSATSKCFGMSLWHLIVSIRVLNEGTMRMIDERNIESNEYDTYRG